MGQNRAPRRCTVVPFDLAMSFGQSQMLESHTVVFDQRMLLERYGRKFLQRGIHDGALVLGAFDEDGNDGRSNLPAIVLNRLIEKVAILIGRR